MAAFWVEVLSISIAGSDRLLVWAQQFHMAKTPLFLSRHVPRPRINCSLVANAAGHSVQLTRPLSVVCFLQRLACSLGHGLDCRLFRLGRVFCSTKDFSSIQDQDSPRLPSSPRPQAAETEFLGPK